ncbi:hypothetical protein T484DRAFT_1786460, partial [Baffinella frigidus]
NVALNAAHERRYYEGVQGMKGEEGELFGIRNLFRLRPSNQLTETNRIMSKASKAVERMNFEAKRVHLASPAEGGAGGGGDDED